MKTDYSGNIHHSHGKILRAHALSGIELSETAYSPFLQIEPHSHGEEAYFNFVLRGGFTGHCGKRAYEVGQSTLVFHAAGEMRSTHFHNQPTRLFNARLNAKWLQGLSERTVILNTTTCFTNGRLIELATRLYRELTNIDTASSLVIEGLILEMLGEAGRHPRAASGSRPPRWLAQVRDMLHAQFQESLRLSDVAATVRVHPAHLSRTFRLHFRCTLGSYIRRLRVEYACHQLASSQSSLTEIAATAGFSDQSHFSRTFKHFTGQTPAEFRASSSLR